MVIPDLILSFIIALIISIIFARILVRKGPRRGFFWFFLPVFLAVFAAGIWAKPYGAPLNSRNWLPFFLAGIFMATLLTILAPRYPKVKRTTQLDRTETLEMLDEIERENKMAELAYISLNLFFWGGILLLILVISSRYIG